MILHPPYNNDKPPEDEARAVLDLVLAGPSPPEGVIASLPDKDVNGVACLCKAILVLCEKQVAKRVRIRAMCS